MHIKTKNRCNNALIVVLIVTLVLSGLLSFWGCAAQAINKSGIIKTPGITISAYDASFKLTSGKRFTVPFQAQTGPSKMHRGDADVIEYYREALDKWGAKRVSVEVPGREEPLFGVMLFCETLSKGKGAGSRSVLIEVPEESIQDASDGRISVIYETYQSSFSAYSKGWVLWLSDLPFPTRK